MPCPARISCLDHRLFALPGVDPNHRQTFFRRDGIDALVISSRSFSCFAIRLSAGPYAAAGNGGRTWIRTREGQSPRDLQSLLVGHLSILPMKERLVHVCAVTAQVFFPAPAGRIQLWLSVADARACSDEALRSCNCPWARTSALATTAGRMGLLM